VRAVRSVICNPLKSLCVRFARSVRARCDRWFATHWNHKCVRMRAVRAPRPPYPPCAYARARTAVAVALAGRGSAEGRRWQMMKRSTPQTPASQRRRRFWPPFTDMERIIGGHR
jgi:hypothetical protein